MLCALSLISPISANVKNHTIMSFLASKRPLAEDFIAEHDIQTLGLRGTTSVTGTRGTIKFPAAEVQLPGVITALNALLALPKYKPYINMGDGAQQSAGGTH